MNRTVQRLQKFNSKLDEILGKMDDSHKEHVKLFTTAAGTANNTKEKVIA